MITIKNQIKKIIGLASIGVVVVGVAIGVLIKENNSKPKPIRSYNDLENQISPGLNTEVSNPRKICKSFFEENQKDLVLKGYTKKDIVDCSFVGCGGIF